MRKTLTLLIAAGALAVAVSACGSTRAAGIVQAPGGGATAASSTATATTTSTTSTAADITPKSGPLSKEPKITKPTGAPPKTLVKKDLVKGTGATLKAGDTVTVNYVGEIYKTGKVFDSSWQRSQTFTTKLSTSAIIPGWVRGLPGMKVGGRRELIIPPSLGYGKKGEPPTIPANSTLIFVVDLLKVSK